MKLSLLMFMVVTLSGVPFSFAGPIKVVTTTSDFGALARELGGKDVKVTVLASPNSDPHFLDARPSYVIKLKKADLLIAGGLGLEDAWLNPLLSKARNRKINRGSRGFIDASTGARILEVPDKVDRAHGDMHGQGNPHFISHPENALIFAARLTDFLIAFRPRNKALYQKGLDQFKQRMQKVNTLKNSDLKSKNLITFHKSFTYIADFLGMNVAGYLESRPGIPPTPSHLKSLIPLVKEKNVRIIYLEPYQRDKQANFLKGKTGVNYKYLKIYPGVKSDSFSGFLLKLYAEVIKDAGGSP